MCKRFTGTRKNARRGEDRTGCEVEYTIAFEDYTYRKGAISLINGSINIFTAKDKFPGLSLKTRLLDMVNGKPVLTNLNYSFIGSGDHSTAGKERIAFQCENGGSVTHIAFLIKWTCSRPL